MSMHFILECGHWRNITKTPKKSALYCWVCHRYEIVTSQDLVPPNPTSTEPPDMLF